MPLSLSAFTECKCFRFAAAFGLEDQFKSLLYLRYTINLTWHTHFLKPLDLDFYSQFRQVAAAQDFLLV